MKGNDKMLNLNEKSFSNSVRYGKSPDISLQVMVGSYRIFTLHTYSGKFVLVSF